MSPGSAQAIEYLRHHHVLTLATHGADGPWAAAVFYVSEGDALFFLSSPTSRHCRDLAQDPRCAATIQDDTDDWTRVKGMQLEGRACEIGGQEALHARQRYAAKFPLIDRLAGAPAALVRAFAKIRWYRLQTERAYFIDNSRGFGHREQVEIARS